MRLEELRRTTTFRLTVLYGVMFAVGTIALLGMVYLRSAVYLSNRVDGILYTEADGLTSSPRPNLRQRLIEELAINGGRTNLFGLFTPEGAWIAGNLTTLPPGPVRDRPQEIPATADFPAARLITRRLPSGETLVVGRDISQLLEMRAIITSALTWSGVLILLIGLACGVAFSIAPLRRLRRLQAVGADIARGDLKRRMPITDRRDELDMFAATVNHMMGEVERLMSEVRGATEIIAHDLLSPLAHATSQLRRLQLSPSPDREAIADATTRIEDVLERFRAILRIAELDSRQRRAGFTRIDLADISSQAADLYEPLAEAAGVRLVRSSEPGSLIDADPKLLFEAVSNLVDNAIKFAGRGSTVRLRTGPDPGHPRLIVEDDGPGIPPGERTLVLQRFYRPERTRPIPGSGLGLAVVAAIVRLHGFELQLEDADPGVRAIIDCRPAAA
jgi:signal transduction histidine kinase